MTAQHATPEASRIRDLRELLARANTAYYVDAAPFMSDQEFDKLLAELVLLEARLFFQSADGICSLEL